MKCVPQVISKCVLREGERDEEATSPDPYFGH